MSGYLWDVGLWAVPLFVLLGFFCVSCRVSPLWDPEQGGWVFAVAQISVSRTRRPRGRLEPQQEGGAG